MRKQKLTSFALIVIGSFLEVYFYFYRFNSDSGMVLMPAVQGIGLTLLLIGLFRLRSNWVAWFFIIPLFLFSVFSTSSGQRQQLVAESEKQVEGQNSEVIAILQSRLDRKLESYNEATGMKSNSFDTVQEMARWRTAVSGVDEDIDSKDSEIEEIENQIMTLKKAKPEESEVGELYLFYEGLFRIPADVIQLILQFSFSFFIAIMAPVGILLWPKPPNKTNWKPLVERWVSVNWTGIRTGQSTNILSKEAFLKFEADRHRDFPSDKYDQIKKAAIKSKAVDKDGITVDNEMEARKIILRSL